MHNILFPKPLVSDLVKKNIDSSSKSNPLREVASSSKKIKSTNFQQKWLRFTYNN